MPIDFRSDQVQTSKIIVTGSTPQKTLLIYSIDADGLPPNQGNIDPAVFVTSSIGSDVFFFVSGAVGGRGGSDPVIAVIGGDLHVSGNLTVDGSGGGGGGGTNFFTAIDATNIYTTSSVAMPYLSSSTGAQITGSFILSSSTPAVILTSVRHGQPSVTANGLYAYSQGYSTAAQGDYSHAEGNSCVASGASSHAEGNATVASNSYAHSEGYQTTASGPQSHSEGQATTASGDQSHAEGYITTASNFASHAEGRQTTASGPNSHAEGYFATASGDSAHAEGSITTASGVASHAEGYGTKASGIYSHAEGYDSIAFGTGSLAVGLGTVASGAVDGISPPTTSQAAFGKYNLQGNTSSLFVIGDGLNNSNRHDVLRVASGSVQVTGSLTVDEGITGSLSGTVAGNPFIVAGSNITANYNSLGQWEVTGSGGGINFFTEIDSTHIYTTSSVAMPYLSASTGAEITGSLVLGQAGNVSATGVGAFAHGGWGGSGIVQALGNYSHAQGGSTITTIAATFGHAEGIGSQAQAQAAHSEGEGTIASGTASHTEGYQTTATQPYAHAEGYQSDATAQGAHAEGYSTTAAGNYSHAEGTLTNASAFYAHAEGWQSTASGLAAHAEGYITIAEGQYSHATGYAAKAFGTGSFAAGLGTVASGTTDGTSPTIVQAALGKYNLENNTVSLFVIGDGLDASNRHDILRVNSGSVQITGSLFVNGAQVTGSQMQKVNLAGYTRTNLTSPTVIGYGYFNPADYSGLASIEFSALGMNMAGVSGGLDLYEQNTSTLIAQLTWSGNSTLTTGSYQYSSFSVPASAKSYEIHLSQSGGTNGGSAYSMVGFVNFNLRW